MPSATADARVLGDVHELTIRQRIQLVSRQMLDNAMTPAMAREALLLMTGLQANVMTEALKAELAYREVIVDCISSEKNVVARGEAVAKTTPAYAKYRELDNLLHQVKQTITTIRGFLRSLDEEMRLQR
jgi:hypothetical protein